MITGGDHIQGDKVVGDKIEIGSVSGGQVHFGDNVIQQFSLPDYTPPPLPEPGELPAPGALPPGSRLIFPRNALFTGRENELLELAGALFYAPAGPVALTAAPNLPAAVSGLGGIGKTQLACELAYRYGRYLHGVHWLNATTDLAAEIAACGAALCLQPWPDKLPEQTALTLAAWQRQPARLVILDNLEDPALLETWLPRLSGLRLLVTTRRSDLAAFLGLHALALKTFTRPESLAFLRRLAPRLRRLPDGDLDPLPRRLGDLPLALHVAGSYLNLLASQTPAAYLAGLEQAGGALRHHPPTLSYTRNPTAHDLDLYAVFELSWKLLDPAAPVDALAQRVFLACGFCAPNMPLPLELLFRAAFENLAQENDQPNRTAFELALHRLLALGLLGRAGGAPEEPSEDPPEHPPEHPPAIHPLLAEFARLQPASPSGTGEPACSPPASSPPASSPPACSPPASSPPASSPPASSPPASSPPASSPPASSPLPASSPPPAPPPLPALAQALIDLSYAANMTGLPANVAPYRPHLPVVAAFLQPHHPATAATLLNNLGYFLHMSGDLSGALPPYQQALEIYRQALGEKHPWVALSLNNLGTLLYALGDLPAARPCLEQALAITREVLGERHPDTARSLNNLGTLLQDLGDLPAARPCLEQALAIRRELLGERHPDTARSLNNLGTLLQDLGDLPAARPYLEQALSIRREVFGERHPDIAQSLNNLGLLLKAQGDLPGARAYYEQALAIRREVLGERHPDIAYSLNNLGSLLQALGDLPAARGYLEQALSIRREVLGERHPDTAQSLNNLGMLLKDLGDLPAARPYLEQALAILTAALGPDHPTTRIVSANLSSLAGR